MEKEIPLRHWHLNDPGVVPNLLQTYQGSPTGICVYEGTLLPKVFRNQIIHCDAGPSIVRAYPVTPDGAGYKATIVNILDGAKKNQWFRPADVCVAPDGSLFVTDWYDPGVGGHAQRDLDRGRIFRVAPPGVKYTVPKVKFDTIDDNIEALKSPNDATRYIAWTNLHKAGAKAEAALLKMYKSDVPHERARALWLLGRIEGKGNRYARNASSDKDPNIRIVGIRLARQIKDEMFPWILTHVNDADAAVRREAALAIRNLPSDMRDLPVFWAWLATKHNGKDRWYLESLGISAAGRWDKCLETFMNTELSNPSHDGIREVIWRSRASKTPEYLAQLISRSPSIEQVQLFHIGKRFHDIGVPTNELPRYFRAFDFQKDSDIKNEALVKLAFGTYADPARAKLITTEAINRLKNFDVNKNPQHAAALDKILDGAKGTTAFVEMVGKFGASKRYPELLTIAQKQPTEQLGVDAIRVLLDRDQTKLLQSGLSAKDRIAAANTAQAIAGAQHDKAVALLLPIVLDTKLDLELRRQATRAVARTKTGAAELIKLAKDKKLSEDVKFAAGSAISTLPWSEIRQQAQGLFPLPTTKGNQPIAAITDLVKMKGNSQNGKSIFDKAGTCAKCHQVNGEGKNVGPDLSEIGKKLSKEGMFESILYPSASILHNYEQWVVETKKGTTANGLLVSRTGEEISIKDAESIVRTFKMSEVETITNAPISLMPADLHQLMSTQELVDVVEYMTTLREARKK
jgi:putative heme-binding domain-containing protein